MSNSFAQENQNLESEKININKSDDKFKVSIGDQVSVISDKAYRHTRENRFEAIGNVVIKHGGETLFGEAASFDFNTSNVEVLGNVRYVGEDYTIFGSELKFNIANGKVEITSGRIRSFDFTVVGEKLIKESDDLIVGVDAEYTTCTDCPESWSVFGRRVRIYLGQYIYVNHAFLKINGVTVLYLPYVVFPIKRGRETGLLFPNFTFSDRDGFTYQQPWFWAMSDQNDMTLSPFISSIRGYGGEFEFRHVFGEGKWAEVNAIGNRDRVYLPLKRDDTLSGDHYLRHFTNVQHHFDFSNYLTHHFNYNFTREMDIVRDYDYFTKEFMQEAEFGGSSFFDFYFSGMSLGIDSYFKRNSLIDNPRVFDNQFVQVPVNLEWGISPFSLYRSETPLLRNISFGADLGLTYFKQNHFSEGKFIRNAYRATSRPFVSWSLLNYRFGSLKSEVAFDSAFYKFPYEEENDTFSKYATTFETEISVEFDRVFGLAYKEEVPSESIDFDKISKLHDTNTNKSTRFEHLVGSYPIFEDKFAKKSLLKVKNSYRHAGEFKLIHYFTSNQIFRGSQKFATQIQDNAGIFDNKDILATKLNLIGGTINLQQVNRKNSLELQWNNSIIKKSAKFEDVSKDGWFLTQNFDYTKLAYINFSQGLRIDKTPKTFNDRLSRFLVETGFAGERTKIDIQEFYFFDKSDHILNVTLTQNLEPLTLQAGLLYNTRANPNERFLNISGEYAIFEWLAARVVYAYDFVEDTVVNNAYSLEYIPLNNCWKIDVGYSKNEVDQRVTMNFYLNFGKNTYTPVTGYSSDPGKL